jgi:Ca2+-binding RTX toxin-like protein
MADVYGTNGWETIDGSDGVTNGADTIFGYLGNDDIFGLGGNDTIKGGGGADSIHGGTGSDAVEYTDSMVGVIVDLKENHGINGTAQGDTFSSVENITGSGQTDTLTGSDGNNTLKGLEGNDHLEGGLGADVLIGGTGIDTARYLTSSAGVTVSLLSGHGSGGDAAGDDLVGIENVMGSDHADTIWGDNGANVLFGGGGSNTLKGFGGSDTLHGGFDNDSLYGMDAVDVLHGSGGDDYLDGGAGADFMSGGTDNDTYIVDDSGDVVTEVGVQGTLDRVKTSTTYTLTSSVEVLETTEPGDVTAIDLVGNWINNTIIGNAGTNTIVGGMGLDTMTGNGGADVFVWSSMAEMGSMVGAAADTVGSDFNAAIGDLIALNPIDADGDAGNGDTAFTFIGGASNPFTAAGQVSWFNDGPGTDTYILLNTDGDVDAEGVVRVLGVHTVDAGWFVL